MGRLEGKVAFVTAAGGAIAGATARLFGLEGAAVACVDIVEENVNKTAVDIEAAGGKAIPIVCDVTDEHAVKAAIDKTVSTYGKLNVVFNAAAYPDPLLPLHELDVNLWQSITRRIISAPIRSCPDRLKLHACWLQTKTWMR